MDQFQNAVLDLVRLGLKGDRDSIRRYAKQLLRKTPADAGEDNQYRERLAQLVVDHSSVQQLARWAAGTVGADSDAAGLVRVEQSDEALPPVLSDKLLQELLAIIRERDRLSELEEAGLGPTRTLLLTGPPGVGKTMTAMHLASKLGVPLVSVDLAALMSSYLGKSGQNLRNAIDYARTVPCVLLLDEFDAIAKRRDDPTDVGELKRIVNILLLELEHWPPTGLLVAATNHPELLDRAIWRRFERVLEIGLPDAYARRQIIRRQLQVYDQNIDNDLLEACVEATVGCSGSELATLVTGATRRSVLSHTDVGADLVRDALDALLRKDVVESGPLFAKIARRYLRMSQRDIGERVGVSHVTVGKWLKDVTPTSKRKTGTRNGHAAQRKQP